MIYKVQIKVPINSWKTVMQTYNKRDAQIEAKYRRKFNDEEVRITTSTVPEANPSPPKNKWLPVSAVKFNQNGSVSMRGSRISETPAQFYGRKLRRKSSKRKVGNPR